MIIWWLCTDLKNIWEGSDYDLKIICSFLSFGHLMIVWWLSDDKQTNKQTNKQNKQTNKQLIIWWLSKNQLLIIFLPSYHHMMIMCLSYDYYKFVIKCSSDDHLRIIWSSFNYHLNMIIWLSFDNHPMITLCYNMMIIIDHLLIC